MKHIPSPCLLRAAASLILLTAFAGPAFADWASTRLASKHEIFVFADKNRDRNIDPAEREMLDVAFTYRTDLHVLDSNQNGKLDREEVDALERIFKPSNTEKRKEKKSKELDKKLEKKFKRNR